MTPAVLPAATLSGDDAALFARIRRRLIPFMFLLYVVSYIDRVNIGFAALQMNADLGLSASVYGLGAGIFFIGYFAFEVPSNLIMERVGARLWMARIMVSWGVISAGMMFTQGARSFYVLRFLLGAAEAGFFPGMILYLTYWFPPRELARTVAWFMTANALAGIVGGPLSGALLGLDGVAGLAGWQWLFLLEGLPAVVLGGLVLVWLPDGPAEAAWLTPADRGRLAAHLVGAPGRRGHDRASTWSVLVDRQVWVFCWLYLALVVGLYGVSFWLPQILERLSGAGAMVIGLLSACPFIVAGIGMVWIGRHSDATGERRWHVALPAFLAAGGLLACSATDSAALALAALSLTALGIWGALAPFWAMPAVALPRAAAAAGIAWINSVGNLGGFIGPYAVGRLNDLTGGFTAALMTLALSMAIAGILALRLTPIAPAAGAGR